MSENYCTTKGLGWAFLILVGFILFVPMAMTYASVGHVAHPAVVVRVVAEYAVKWRAVDRSEREKRCGCCSNVKSAAC